MKILTPLAVPWMVAPMQANVTVLTEDDEYGNHQVRFAAVFGVDAAAAAQERRQQVCLTFTTYGWMRRTPRVSATEVILRAEYDWSRVTGAPLAGESGSKLDARVERLWRETGLCPDPKVYTVENSDWHIGHDKARFRLQHFLVVGEASCVEVLAGRCDWIAQGKPSTSSGPIPGENA